MRSHASGGRTTETPLTKAEGVLLSFQLLLLCGSVSLLYSSNTAGKKWQLRLQGYAFPPLVFQAGEEKPVLCNRGAVTPYMLRRSRNSSFCTCFVYVACASAHATYTKHVLQHGVAAGDPPVWDYCSVKSRGRCGLDWHVTVCYTLYGQVST